MDQHHRNIAAWLFMHSSARSVIVTQKLVFSVSETEKASTNTQGKVIRTLGCVHRYFCRDSFQHPNNKKPFRIASYYKSTEPLSVIIFQHTAVLTVKYYHGLCTVCFSIKGWDAVLSTSYFQKGRNLMIAAKSLVCIELIDVGWLISCKSEPRVNTKRKKESLFGRIIETSLALNGGNKLCKHKQSNISNGRTIYCSAFFLSFNGVLGIWPVIA